MKTKLLRSLTIAVCIFFYMSAAKGFQIKETLNFTPSKDNVNVSSFQQDTIIPLECDALIDPSWLQPLKKGIITSKALEEPTIRVAYLIPSNRNPQEKGVDALQYIIRAGRDFFKDHMAYNGLDPKTFRYETEADGETPLIHVVNIPETDAQIRDENQHKAWTNTINAARKAGLSVWQRGEIWLLVAETHIQWPDGSMSAEIALGAGSGSANDPGVAILGSTKLTLIAEGAITDNRPYHRLIIPEIGPYPLGRNVSFPSFEGSSLSSITSSTVGAFVHELGHAMGLLHHDIRNDFNFHGNLMGHGLRGIRGHLYPDRYPDDYTRLAFTSAQALNSSHYFNAGKHHNQVDNVSFSLGSNTPQEGHLTFNVSASDADGLSLLQLFGRPDYSVERVLSGAHFEGQVRLPYFEPGTQTKFILKVYDKQGNKTERTINVIPRSGNRAPWPFMRFSPPIGESGDTFVLDASRSRDPNGNSRLTFEWDFDNDGVYDTKPIQNPLTTKNFYGGNHLIRLKVTEPSGAFTVSTPMALHVAGDPPPATEVNFTLIDAETNKAIPGFDPMPEGAEINLSTLPKFLSIRANVPGRYESVRFDFDGKNGFQVENEVPYALFGDEEGDYASGLFPLGSYILSATPFKQNGAQGEYGTKGTIRFSVVEDPVTFTLIDASTNQVITGFDPIPEGAEINLYTLPKHLSIRANVNTQYESVRFNYDGATSFRVENLPPYALFGDLQGDYYPGLFLNGRHTLVATPFSQDNARGTSGMAGILHFSVVKKSVSFSLVDADTDQDLFTIENGMVIDLITIKDKNLNIKTNHDRPLDGLSVRFSINTISGSINRIWTEHEFPYSIFGDVNGDFNGVKLPEGSYHILAILDYGADPGFEVEPSIELNFKIRGSEISHFVLFSPTPGDEPAELRESGQIFYSNGFPFSNNIAIIAIIANAATEVGSVVLRINGPINHKQTENIAPYSLFGNIDRVFNAQKFPVGDYTLSATPYSEAEGQGLAGKTLTVSFKILERNYILNGAGLVDAENKEFLDELLSADDGNLTLRSLVDNATVVLDYDCINGPCPESVSMSLSGPLSSSRVENERPFTLFGDTGGNFMGRTLPTGEYRLMLTPYTMNDGMGIAGRTITADFRIIDTFSFSGKHLKAILYPNPASDMTFVKTEDNTSIFKTIISDITGKKVKEYTRSVGSEQEIDVSGLKKGLYMVQIDTGNERVTKKLVVN